MEKIYFGKTVVALRIKKMKPGSVPMTEPESPLQILTLKHPRGKHIQAHIHKPVRRETNNLQECLLVRKGKVKVDLYTRQKKFVKYVYLTSGDTLLLVNGGWGVHMLTDCELIEVKNGPYKNDKVNIII